MINDKVKRIREITISRHKRLGNSGHSDIIRAPDLSTKLLVLPLSQLTPRLLLLTNSKSGLSHGQLQLLLLAAGEGVELSCQRARGSFPAVVLEVLEVLGSIPRPLERTNT